MARLEDILNSRSYVKASEDVELLQRDELRSVRLGLELTKPDLLQREQGIVSTIVVFGSARIPEPAEATANDRVPTTRAPRSRQRCSRVARSSRTRTATGSSSVNRQVKTFGVSTGEN